MFVTGSGELQTYHFHDLTAERGLVHFVSARQGGVSRVPYAGLNLAFHVGDAEGDVLQNRRRLMEHVGIPLAWAVFGQQVHGGNVSVVDRSKRGRGAFSDQTAVEGTDALITGESDVCLAVLTADCVPVVLYDRRRRVAGVVHAGWKGTVLGIARNTIQKMIECFGSNPADIAAGIGPSIGPNRYEVGPEVIEQALDAFPDANVVRRSDNGKGFFDLWAANRHQLLNAGLASANIEVAGICTYQHAETFYSARRRQPTGRFVTAVMMV